MNGSGAPSILGGGGSGTLEGGTSEWGGGGAPFGTSIRAGTASATAGGGGAGLGGAIFVADGGTLTLANSSFQNNAATGGAGGNAGQGKGGAIFVMGSATATQCNSTYSGNTASAQQGVPGFMNADNNDAWGTIADAPGLCAATPPCPKGQGFWKNTLQAWPTDSLTLGSQTYTKTYTRAALIEILRLSEARDASLILADQLIAAKLNAAAGSEELPAISDAISTADALFSELAGRLPYRIRPQSPLGAQMVTLAATLGSYNNDALTPTCTL